MLVEKTCEACNNSFMVPSWRVKTAKACSHACAVIVRAKSRERKVDVVCKCCSKVFQAPQSHADRRVYCSHECRELSPDTVARKASGVMSKNSMWSGGIVERSDGYLYEKTAGHPFASNGYVLQHRLVAERYLRAENKNHHFLTEVDGEMYISRELDVHHINKDKTDNDPANLVICTRMAHSMFHRGLKPAQSDYWLAAPI